MDSIGCSLELFLLEHGHQRCPFALSPLTPGFTPSDSTGWRGRVSVSVLGHTLTDDRMFKYNAGRGFCR